MRIALIAHLKYPIAEPFSGGLEMHTHLLARILKRRGHSVSLFASTRSDPSLGVEPICDATALDETGTDEADDVTFFREHHAYLDLMGRLRRSDFDIVQNNSLHYLPVSMADTLPMPIVTTLHTPPFCWLESGIRTGQCANSHFVAVSHFARQMWQHVIADCGVVPNGVDLGHFVYRAQPDPDPYLFWQGRIVPEKGLHYAIDAARIVGMKLRVAGPILDEDYYAAEILPRLGNDVSLLGHLDHDELQTMMGGAHALVCTPCWEEPYGLVVAEALACGVPVAAFDRGALGQIIDETCGALAAPDDTDALARAIGTALTLDRRDCRHRARNFCDAERMVDGYEDLYARLVGIDPAAAPECVEDARYATAV